MNTPRRYSLPKGHVDLSNENEDIIDLVKEDNEEAARIEESNPRTSSISRKRSFEENVIDLTETPKRIPNRAFVFTNLHGFIFIDEKKEIPKFFMPDNLSMKYICFSSPGCVAIGPSESLQDTFIKEHLLGLRKQISKIPLDQTDIVLENFRKKIEELNCCENNSVENVDFPADFPLEKQKKIIDSYHKSGRECGYSRVTTVNPGDITVNKLYENETENSDIRFMYIRENRNVHINPFAPERFVTLEEILNFLSETGITEVVFIDFSCSNFHFKNKSDNTDESTLAIQKRIFESRMKYGGKPKLLKKKLNKTNNLKKRHKKHFTKKKRTHTRRNRKTLQ